MVIDERVLRRRGGEAAPGAGLSLERRRARAQLDEPPDLTWACSFRVSARDFQRARGRAQGVDVFPGAHDGAQHRVELVLERPRRRPSRETEREVVERRRRVEGAGGDLGVRTSTIAPDGVVRTPSRRDVVPIGEARSVPVGPLPLLMNERGVPGDFFLLSIRTPRAHSL